MINYMLTIILYSGRKQEKKKKEARNEAREHGFTKWALLPQIKAEFILRSMGIQ